MKNAGPRFKPANLVKSATLGGTFAAALLGAVFTVASPADAQQRTRVSIGVTETIASHNPYADSVSLMYAVLCQTYGCLFDRDYAGQKFTSRIVDKYEVKDPLTWVFNLKRDIKRNNGEPVVAADIIHSVNRAKNDPQSRQKHNVRYIESVEAPDDHTIIMKTTEPLATLLDFLRQLIITSKAQFDAKGEAADREAPVGFGPYRIRQLSVDNFVAIEKVAGHPEVSPDNPDEVVFRIQKEAESRVTALLNGETQIAQFIPPQLVPRVEAAKNVRLLWEGSTEIMFLAMSPQFKPWDTKEARQAVAYAIDRDAIIKAILRGQAERLDGPIGPGQYAFDPDLKPKYTYNPAKARELLKQAGYPNGVEIDFFTPVSRYIGDKQIAEAIVPMLEAVGFKVNLRTPEWGTLWSNVQRGGVPFYYMGRGTVIDPSAALSQYFETGASPRIGYSNKEVDRLLQAERQEFDEPKRIALLRQAMALITEEAPAHFMLRHKLAWGVARNIEYKPLATTDILATDIRMVRRQGATR
jgi:peptide/nickel transport system substrate-binding protein